SSSKTLPHRRDGTGIPDADRGAQVADVYTQLEGVGRDDAQYLTVAKPAFDGAARFRQITSAVRHDGVGASHVGAPLPQVREQDLHAIAGLSKHDARHA